MVRPRTRRRSPASCGSEGRAAITKPQRSSPKPSAAADSGSAVPQKYSRPMSASPCVGTWRCHTGTHAASPSSRYAWTDGGACTQIDQSKRSDRQTSAAMGASPSWSARSRSSYAAPVDKRVGVAASSARREPIPVGRAVERAWRTELPDASSPRRTDARAPRSARSAAWNVRRSSCSRGATRSLCTCSAAIAARSAPAFAATSDAVGCVSTHVPRAGEVWAVAAESAACSAEEGDACAAATTAAASASASAAAT